MSRAAWTEALEAHADLTDRLSRPSAGAALFDGFMEAAGVPFRVFDATGLPTPPHAWQADSLSRAETYWVAGEMVDVVDHASRSMQPEALIPEDLPTQRGFALLERSVLRTDVRGRTVSFRAISWERVFFGDEHDPVGDGRRVDTRGDGGQYGGVAYVLWVDVEEPEDAINQDLWDDPLRKSGGRFQAMHVGFMPFDHHPDEFGDIDDDDGAPDQGGRVPLPAAERHDLFLASWRWHQTFWRLMGQRVAHESEGHPDRATARRVARTASIASLFVRVITLRQYRDAQPPIDGEREVSWSHRWITSGHWRNQPYPSLGVHRQIWIAPFVKGPADKPLVIKDRVYQWTR